MTMTQTASSVSCRAKMIAYWGARVVCHYGKADLYETFLVEKDMLEVAYSELRRLEGNLLVHES